MQNTSAWPESWSAHDQKMKPYLWSHRAVGWSKSGLGLLILYVLLFTPIGFNLEVYFAERIETTFLRWLCFFGVVGAVWLLLTLPFSLLSFYVERQFGMSKQSLVSWFADLVKGLGLGAVIGTITLGFLYLSVRFFPAGWWFSAATFLVLFSILLAQLTPVLLLPLFFQLKPMEAGVLKERLLALCKKFEVEVGDVYHLGLGMKTEKGNAAFVGLGKTKRILIGDTLYERFSHDEVEAVFAHELGHQVNNDLWKGISIAAVLLYISFFLASLIVKWWVFPAFGTDLLHPIGLFLFLVTLTVVQYPSGVLQAMYSRSRERAADRFAEEKIGLGAKLADALERLTFQNYSVFRPNAVMEFLTHSHPASWRRITKLRHVGNPS
jgi:STE24 endopeptidase